jgi:hypothetical protein
MYIPTVQRVVVPTAHWSTGARLPDNSELRRIAQDVLAAVKYAVCVHAIDPSRPARGSEIDGVIAAAIRTMPPEKQRRYRDTAAELLASGPAVRRGIFGRYASIDPDSARRLGVRGMGDQLGPVKVDPRLLGLPRDRRGGFKVGELEAAWGLVVAADPVLPEPPGDFRTFGGTPPAGDSSIPFPGYYKTLKFRVQWLDCVQETAGLGSDEIAISGVFIGADGSSAKVPTKVIVDFDSGDKEPFTPPWEFAVFPRPAPASGQVAYDKYNVIVAMAEKEGGGFGDFVTDLWDKVKEEVQAAIKKAVASATQPALGTFAPIAGEVAAWAVNELVGLLMQLFEDQIFDPQVATITTPRGFVLPGPGDILEGGSIRTPQHDLHLYGHGFTGHYALRHHWLLTDWVAGSGSQ